MYYAPNRAMAQSYGNVDKNSRIAAANAHELVEIMFEQLLLRIDRALKCLERGDMPAMFQSRARASDILNALEESLDFDRGGEIATTLAVVYREASNRLNAAQGADTEPMLRGAREIISEISDAWTQIGRK